MSNIFSWTIFILLGLIVAFFIIPVLPIAEEKKYQVAIVLSGSMEPQIQTGGIAVYKKTNNQLQQGDIIAFQTPGNKQITTIHRIAEILDIEGQTAYQTKGDNNDVPDNYQVPLSYVKGRFLFTLPYVGYLIHLMQQPRTMKFFIVSPILLLILWEIINFLIKQFRPKTQN